MHECLHVCTYVHPYVRAFRLKASYETWPKPGCNQKAHRQHTAKPSASEMPSHRRPLARSHVGMHVRTDLCMQTFAVQANSRSPLSIGCGARLHGRHIMLRRGSHQLDGRGDDGAEAEGWCERSVAEEGLSPKRLRTCRETCHSLHCDNAEA